MKQIFFNNRALVICGPDANPAEDPESVIFFGEGTEALKGAIETFDQNPNIARLYIPSENIEATYNVLRSIFTEVEAAGGLVRNGEGKYLFIRRNGLWDLPKGKAEKNEDPEETAVREVMEECGISKPEITDLLCITDHTYHRDGKFVLKHTYWYAMETRHEDHLIPQTEEDITEAIWVSQNEVEKYASDTYPSIVEVLKAAELL